MPQSRKRRNYFVDKRVQGALLVLAARHWLLSVAGVAGLTLLGWMFITPGVGVLINLRQQMPSLVGGLVVALVASLIVLPVILFDVLKLSNRFVGPMVRLRRAMEQAAAGEEVAEINFRNDDFWQEIAATFNRLNDRLQQQSPPNAQVSLHESEPSEYSSVG